MTNPFIEELKPKQQTGNPFLDEIEEKGTLQRLGEGFLSGAKSALRTTGNLASGTPQGAAAWAEDIVTAPYKKQPEGTAGAIGNIAGNIAGSLPLMGAVGEMVGPVGSTAISKFLGPAATKAGTFLKGAAAAIPKNIVGGVVATAATDPRQVITPTGLGKVAALSTIGSVFDGGFALRAAIKAAKTPQALQQVAKEVEELFNPQPTPQTPNPLGPAEPVPPSIGELPSHIQVAAARVKQILDKDLEVAQNLMKSEIEKAGKNFAKGAQPTATENSVAFLKKASQEANRQTDPLYLAMVNGVQERAKQIRDMSKAIQLPENAGKGTKTGMGLGVPQFSADMNVQPQLTIKELQDHLSTLNMNGVFDDVTNTVASPFLKNGEKVFVDPDTYKKFQLTQAKLDAAAAEGRANMNIADLEDIAKDMETMAKRLSRGFDVPQKGPLYSGKPESRAQYEKTVRNVEGNPTPSNALDLPTEYSINENSGQIPTWKRWVTGSDAEPVPATPQLQQMAKQNAIDYSDAVKSANIEYGSQRKSNFQVAAENLRNAKTEFQDRTWGMGQHDPATHEMLKKLSYVGGAADDFANNELRIAKLDKDGNWTGESEVIPGKTLNQALKGIQPDEVAEADAYIKAMTYKNNPGLKRDMSDDAIDSIIKNAPDHIKQFGQDFRHIDNVLVEDAARLGVMSRKAADEWIAKGVSGTLKGATNNPQRAPAFAFRQGPLNRPTLSPIQQLQDDIFARLEFSRKNYAFQQLVKARNLDRERFAGVFEPATLEKPENFEKLVTDMMDRTGLSRESAEEITMLNQSMMDQSDKNLTVLIDGKPTRWKIDSDLDRTVTSLTPLQKSLMRDVMKEASLPVRVGVSAALDLSGVGPASDALLTMGRVPGFIPVIDNLRGLFNSFGNWSPKLATEAYKERTAALGKYSGRFQPGEEMMKGLQNKYDSPVKDAAMKGVKVITSPVKALQKIITPLSDAARMGDYMVRRRQGQTPFQATSSSNSTLGDWNVHGANTLLRNFIQITEFQNVGIQTLKMMKDAATDPKTKARLFNTLVSGVTLPTLGFWALAQNDKELNSYRLSDTGYRYWWWRDSDGEIHKMPKLGWAFGQIFGSNIEALLDAVKSDEEKSDIAKRLLDGYWSQVGINPMPLKIQNGMALMFNKRSPLSPGSPPITPESQQGLPADLQGNENTSGIARYGAEHGVNPFTTDYMLDQMTGSIFSSTVKMLSGRTAGTSDADFPVLSRFHIRNNTPTQGSGEFYRDLEKAQNFEKTRKKYIDSGQADKVAKLFDDNRELLENKGLLEATSSQVMLYNKYIMDTMRDPTISTETKRKTSENYRKLMNESFQRYIEIKKGMKKDRQ